MRNTVPSRFGDLDAIRATHDTEVVDMLVDSVFKTDTAADALVERFAEMPGGSGWAMLDRALRDGVDAVPEAPAELLEVVADALAPPDWVDFDLIDRGAVAWWRTGGLLQLLALTAGSLAYGYSTSFARPLIQTGRLTRRAPRRLAETASWVTLATRPGGLRPGAAGLRETVHIRMVHALVRAQIHRKGEWDVANWGEPISVGDTLATGIIGFFAYPIDGLRDIGVDYSDEELEAMTHLWSWITYLMGVPRTYLPVDYAHAVRMFEAGSALDQVLIEGADELLDALFFDSVRYDKLLPGPLSRPVRAGVGHLMSAFARRWMGGERADLLDIRASPASAAIPAVRALVTAREQVRSLGLLPPDRLMVQLEFAVTGALQRHVVQVRPVRPGDVQAG